MQFVHITYAPYDRGWEGVYATREAAEAAVDNPEYMSVSSVPIEPFEPQSTWKATAFWYASGRPRVLDVAEYEPRYISEWWFAECGQPEVTWEVDSQGTWAFVEILAWDDRTAWDRMVEFLLTIRPPVDEGPVQGPPSPWQHCAELDRSSTGVHTGSSVSVYNTGRRWGPGDYSDMPRQDFFPLVIDPPEAQMAHTVAEEENRIRIAVEEGGWAGESFEEAVKQALGPYDVTKEPPAENPGPGFSGYDERWWEEMSPDANNSTAPYIRIVGGRRMPSHAPYENGAPTTDDWARLMGRLEAWEAEHHRRMLLFLALCALFAFLFIWQLVRIFA